MINSNNCSGNSNSSIKLKKYDPTVDKLHRQLIENIRLKDTHSFISSLEAHQIDLNFMDDVGQTLLNWASAFGTAEMVEYLASRGADVNKGLRSSSLHYAACFGRASVVKLLLSYGANPDLRDEEGKTALDKARERGEESHREVVQILQHAPAVVGDDGDGVDFDGDGDGDGADEEEDGEDGETETEQEHGVEANDEHEVDDSANRKVFK